MGQIKEINIKNQTYYFFDDMINIKNFHSNLLKIDVKSYKDIDIYYIGYITIKKFGDCENIHTVNPLYLIIHSAIKEKNDKIHLILGSTDKYKEVWSGIRSAIKTLNDGKELFYQKNYARIAMNADDNLPLNKPLACEVFLCMRNLFVKKTKQKKNRLQFVLTPTIYYTTRVHSPELLP